MKKIMAVLAVGVSLATTPALGQEVRAGARITITSDWHAKNGGPYKPNIVKCKSDSGMCLRDTRNSPANTPMVRSKNGLQASFPKFGVTYVFRPGGNGVFYDAAGKPVGNFNWTQ